MISHRRYEAITAREVVPTSATYSPTGGIGHLELDREPKSTSFLLLTPHSDFSAHEIDELLNNSET